MTQYDAKTPVRKEEGDNEELSDILEEIEIEDLTIDGICGVY